jgi:membrane associated rhomboid family serine protease
MFPLHDDNPTLRPPWVTWGLVAATAFVWIVVQGAGLDPGRMAASVCALGAIPLEVLGRPGVEAGPCLPGAPTTGALVTSMFLHGGWLHLIGNLWFLWIFGNNVEDSMGRLRFLAFYLIVGLVAALAHVAAEPDSALPMVGASGAISGVMGAYLVLFPRARVKTLLVLIVFFTVVELPAFVYLLYWLALQLVSSAGGSGAGVAFWAHIGGFVAGVVLVPLFRRRRPPPDRWARAEVRV